MPCSVEYTKSERFWLVALGAVGLLGVKGVLVFSLLFWPDALVAALAKPPAAAFIIPLVAASPTQPSPFPVNFVSPAGSGTACSSAAPCAI